MDINQALPEDILYEILTRVPILDSGRCRMVCKMWDSMMNEVTFKMTRRAKKDYVWFRDLHKNGFLLVKLKQALYNRKITRLEGMFSVKLERKPSKKFGDAQFSNQADCVIALKSADELFVLNLLSGYCRSVGKFPGLMGFGIGFKIHEGVLSVRVFVHNLDLTGVCIDVGVVTASQTITGDIPAFPCEWGDGMFLGGIVYSICQWSSQIVAFDFETSKFLTLGFPLDVKPNLVSRSNARVGHFDGCLSFSHSLGELCKIWLRKKDVWHSFSTIGGRRGVCVPISRLTGDLLLVDSDYGVQVMDTNNQVLSLMQNKVKFCGKNTHLFVHPFSARHFKAMKKKVEIGGCKTPVNTLISEPFVPQEQELNLSVVSQRLGCTTSFSECGGIEIEENWDKVCPEKSKFVGLGLGDNVSPAHIAEGMRIGLCQGGELLDRILSRVGKYSEEDAKAVMIQILSVTAYCHLQGVVHRDLKPENFLFTSKDDNSALKAIDFGLSDYVKPDERLNDIVGSAYYVAPEVLHRSYGTEADMWSIGVIAYILLCGSRPFWARTESGIFRAVLKADPSFDEAPWPSLSLEAKDFVKRLLNKDYRKRLTAAQALSHPWFSGYPDVKIPQDMIVYRLVRAYICSSSLRKASLQALAKTLTVPQLTYLKEQFQMLSPSKNGYVSLQNFKTTIVRNATDAIKDSRVIEYVNMVSSLQYRKMDFEEFCAAAISVHQLEAMDTWEQHARHAYELFEKDGNRPIMIEELASELGLSPSVPVHVVLQDWIRHSDGKLSFLGFVRLLHGVSSRTFQKA